MFLYCTCFFFLHKYVYHNNVTCNCSIIYDCCIRVTVVLEYISSQSRGEQLARPIRSEVILFTVKKRVVPLPHPHQGLTCFDESGLLF